ncbi:class I SAM-dependent methyltransferase [Actinoplanes aureus]|uniref:Class I SAM-dependent methyltransferase n=1 Tax=Actinoplanes aureus TaxID=2792083 RepID=A0A931FZ84_9ACTN|nr:class I SAM-dependent methyltransferase [Actinoplanes aureus]MBG0564480.1 class I SAM-dependent methyltransferase [Actinoplanes aureus]
MDDLAHQTRYWDTAGAGKTFMHPLEVAWLATVGRSARILDYGCGYGRTMTELRDLGFADVSGVDISTALIERGRRTRPGLDLSVIDSPPSVPHAAASFDVIMVLAVLTCIPDDQVQDALVAELDRVLAPGGLIYVSDLVLQPDERNRQRYAAYVRSAREPYGTFMTEDGAVCRHHDPGHLRRLFARFDLIGERHVDTATMNGRRASALQMLVRK